MLSSTDQLSLLPDLIHLSALAGDAIMEVYESGDKGVEYKADDSPLTRADRHAHDIIDARLRDLTPTIPVLSEEGATIPFEDRADWSELWLVDPLDGTREFVKHNGEFTVNIALIQQGEPVLGVILAPARREVWAGVTGEGAWKLAREEFPEQTDAIPQAWRDASLPIQVREHNPSHIDIIASRTHFDSRTRTLIDRISADHANVGMVNIGSSLKLCTVAEGSADIYPRFAPTSEWDVAAGHAIVRAAGGEIYQANPEPELELDAAPAHADWERYGHSPHPLRYNKEDILNPWFVVRSW